MGLEINKIYCDSADNFLKEIPENSVDLFVQSPPYGSVRDYTGEGIWNFEIFSKIAAEICRVTKPGGINCWIIGDTVENGGFSLFPQKQAIFFQELGFILHEKLIYQKRNFSHPCKNRYHNTYEEIFVFSKGRPKTFNPICDRKNLTAGAVGNLGINTFTEKDGSKSVRKKQITKEFGKRHNVWLGNTAGQEFMCKKLNHPAIAPRWLTEDLIKSYSNPGDLVVDCFSGAELLWSQLKS